MTTTALSAAEVALVTNDKPVLIASNAVESSAVEKWISSNNLTSGTDRVLAANPIKRVYDRHLHLQTKTDAAAETSSTWYLAFDLGASVADYDCAFIGGHNFGTIGSLTTCSIEIGTDATFGSVTQIATFSPGTSNKRLVSFFSNRYSGERYVRLKLAKGSNIVPAVGEFWLGRRRHLEYQFDRSLDDLRTSSQVVAFESKSGVRTNYILSKGQLRRSGQMVLEGDQKDPVVSFWSECGQGSKPFLFCAAPGTTPESTQLMNQDPELDLELVGPDVRRFSLDMREVAPFYEVET